MASRQAFIKKFNITKVELVFVSMTSVQGEIIDIVDEESDPYDVMQKKIELIQEAFDCDAEEAQRILLTHS